ncbi:putative glutathione-S-transferase theta, GST [Annulohypoxylon maeteangense]|uniref:putative glutathione-S-transferase theta, GST n=1 Tax=Annulohypoxylon maeteangense TaxID=1927788 RepID=UPI002007CFC5|nr:putative glutathione-S-transferase theta, GST [Annulohypoxylon maeteangense]KAI0883126.1 putative glutathione-S-transferase theta, GST [Annulohypoxylon maeteangense]
MAAVDTTELPTQTTGAAARLASSHATEHPLKLYGGWFCPFVQRAWIVLCEKRIPYQYVEINPYAKAPEFLALNPRGLVPTLGVPFESVSTSTSARKGGGEKGEGEGVKRKPLYESAVICEYLDEAYDDVTKYGRSLLPEDAYERARCRLWIDHIGGKIIPGFYRFIQHTPEKEYSIEEAREGFLGHVKTFVREMMESEGGGPWFLGERFGLVDVMLAPWAKRLFLIDHYKPGGLGIPVEGQGGDDEVVWKRWRVWFDAITSRQSVKDTWSDDAQYIIAYRRYAEDKTQSEVAKATRKGERLP